MKNLFVYGTLKRGGALHANLQNSTFVKITKLKGFKMYKYTNWFPAIIKSDNPKDVVFGEVYKITDDMEKILDSVEGYPSLYQKEMTKEGLVYFMEDAEYISKNFERVQTNNWDVNDGR